MQNDQEFRTVRGYQLLEEGKKFLTSAMEDYLEMIYRYSLKENYVRINTLAELLNVRASSATKMVQSLARLNLLNYKKYGIILLTKKGKELGKSLYDRHNIIEKFLKTFGDITTALVETELIEHNLSSGTLKRLASLNRFIEANPDFIERFEKFVKNN